MKYSVATRKVIIWTAGVLVALIPILFGITKNLSNFEGMFMLSYYNRFYSELLFFSISVTVVALFDSIELVSSCKRQEKISRNLYYVGITVLVISLIIGSVSFGNHAIAEQASLEKGLTTASIPTGYICYWFLAVMVLIASAIKFLHSARGL